MLCPTCKQERGFIIGGDVDIVWDDIGTIDFVKVTEAINGLHKFVFDGEGRVCRTLLIKLGTKPCLRVRVLGHTLIKPPTARWADE